MCTNCYQTVLNHMVNKFELDLLHLAIRLDFILRLWIDFYKFTVLLVLKKMEEDRKEKEGGMPIIHICFGQKLAQI